MKKKICNFEFLLNNVSIILVINLMFFRGIWFSSINATGISMSLLLVQTVLVLISILKNRRIPVSILLNTDFIILAFINSLISSLFFLNNTSLSKILIELTIVGGLIFNFSYLIKKKKIKLSQLANVIVFIGSLLSIYILRESLNVGSVRRFKSLPTSVNYLSHSLMISLYLNGYYVFKQKTLSKKIKIYRLVFFFIQLSALLLLGSRSTLVSLVLISLYLLRYMSFNKKNLRFILIILIFGSITFFYITTKIDLTNLLTRFEIKSFTQGAGRIDIWREILRKFDLKTLLFGSYWEYEIVGGNLGPHNAFLSFFYFFGFLPGFLFVYKNIKLISKQLTSRYFTSLFPIYIISLVYSSLSGHFTRVYPLYIILSILFELQDYSNKLNNNINNQAM